VLVYIGFALIIIGWIEQVYRSLAKKRLSFSPFFLTFYLIGTAILAYNSLSQADVTTGALNAAAVVLAFILLVALIAIRRKPGAF
jgi:hypothetical protein